MDVKSRLLQYLEYKDITVRQAEIAAGLGNGAISKLGPGSRASTIEKIAKALGISRRWLLTGEGERDATPEAISQAEGSKRGLIPFYDAQTTGGYEGHVSSASESVALKGYIDAGGWFNGRETAAIRHVGDSMTEYPDGCILAVREVRDSHLLVPGQVYVVETDEYRVTKRYQRGSQPDSIALYSSNKEKYDDGRLVYEPFEVLKEDIRRIFLVLGYIVNQSGEIKLIKI